MSNEAQQNVISEIAAKYGIPKYAAKELIPYVLDMAIKAAFQYGRVQFGTHVFMAHTSKERQGRNPKTGEKIMIAPKTRIRYKNRKAVISED